MSEDCPLCAAGVPVSNRHGNDRCQLCGDTKNIRYLGRDNSEIVEDCPDCAGTGPSTARAGVTWTELQRLINIDPLLAPDPDECKADEVMRTAFFYATDQHGSTPAAPHFSG